MDIGASIQNANWGDCFWSCLAGRVMIEQGPLGQVEFICGVALLHSSIHPVIWIAYSITVTNA